MDSKEFLDALNLVAKEKGIDFAVVAPDDPLVLGMVDALNAIGIPCFGPDKKAALIRKLYLRQSRHPWFLHARKTSAQARILRWLSTENPAMLPAMRRKPLQALWKIRSWKSLWKWQEC